MSSFLTDRRFAPRPARRGPASVIAPNDSRIAAEVTAKVVRVHAEVGGTVESRATAAGARPRRLPAGAGPGRSTGHGGASAGGPGRATAPTGLTLRQKQFVSDDAVLELQTGVQAAEAELDVAQAQRAVAARNVEKCRIIAPFAGVVLERQAQVGAMATPGTPLLRLVDLAPPEIEAQIQAAWADELPARVRCCSTVRANAIPAGCYGCRRWWMPAPVPESPGWPSPTPPRPPAAAATCAGPAPGRSAAT
jgi:hypothetical protein